MVKKAPRVSIGMPVYNGEQFIRAALNSILAQTFRDFELIISDNSSTDRTEEICRDFAIRDGRIQYTRNGRNLGVAANCNRVFELSSGKYFKWFAHDDVIAPRYLQRCVDVLEGAPSVVVCIARMRYIDDHGAAMGDHPVCSIVGEPCPSVRFGRTIFMPGPFFGIMVYGLMRASALRRTRLFGHYFEWDQILVPELSLLGEFVEIPEPLHFGRLHEDQSFRIPTWEARSTFMSGADKPRSWLMTRLGIILERFRVIGQSSVSRGEKARCYVHLVLFTGSRLRRQIRLWFWRIWARLTRGALIASKFTHIPLRLWALARCLRSDGWLRFGQAIRAAAIAEEDLVFTMAQAVMARNDRAANRMMECWLADPVEGRRLAAATALGARLEAISRRSWPRPAIKSERRTCAVLLAERVNLETSIRILRTLVDTLAAYGTAEEKVTMDRALSNRSDVDPFAIDEFRRCIRAELPDPQTTGLRFTGRCDALARS